MEVAAERRTAPPGTTALGVRPISRRQPRAAGPRCARWRPPSADRRVRRARSRLLEARVDESHENVRREKKEAVASASAAAACRSLGLEEAAAPRRARPPPPRARRRRVALEDGGEAEDELGAEGGEADDVGRRERPDPSWISATTRAPVDSTRSSAIPRLSTHHSRTARRVARGGARGGRGRGRGATSRRTPGATYSVRRRRRQQALGAARVAAGREQHAFSVTRSVQQSACASRSAGCADVGGARGKGRRWRRSDAAAPPPLREE